MSCVLQIRESQRASPEGDGMMPTMPDKEPGVQGDMQAVETGPQRQVRLFRRLGQKSSTDNKSMNASVAVVQWVQGIRDEILPNPHRVTLWVQTSMTVTNTLSGVGHQKRGMARWRCLRHIQWARI